MLGSKPSALPLGYTPIKYISITIFFKLTNKIAGVPGFEPGKCWDQNPVPYRLAIPQLVTIISYIIHGAGDEI